MPIVFEQLPGETETEIPPGNMYGVLPITGFSYASSIVALGAAGGGTLDILLSSEGSEALVPAYGSMYGALGLEAAYSYGAGTEEPATMAGVMAITGYVLEGADFMFATLPLFGVAFGGDLDEPPLFFDNMFESELDSLLMTEDTWSATLVHLLRSLMRVSDRYEVAAKLFATLSSNVRVREFFTAILEGRVDDAFAMNDSVEATAYLVALLSDQLMVVDGTTSHLNALVTVASAMVIADAMVAGYDGRIDETFVFTDEMNVRVVALVALASELSVLDTFEVGLSMFAVVNDAFQISDDPSVLLSMIAEILDGFSVGVRLRTPAGDEYAGYTLNVRNSAVSEYTNYAYNSMAIIGGKLYGLSAAGLFLLEGATDNGTPIDASLRLGMTDFGTNLLKRVPAAYVGYTSDGQLLLKVITTDKGIKQENHYRLAPRLQTEPGGSRFTPAKGLVGMYLGFELTNVAGADFALDVIKVWPVALNRRYSGR